jgi:predicted nuclease of predicted toxin-antitoxin system
VRVLLDECLPRQLERALVNHEVVTVPEAGWAGTKNGALLRLAEARFDVFITADQNVEYQQNLRSTVLGIIVLVAPNNRYPTLQPLMSEVLAALATVQPGVLIHIPIS